MPEALYITAYCNIAHNKIAKDGKIVFEQEAGTAGEFLMAAYRHFNFAYPKYFKMDNLAKSGWLAAELLTESRNLSGYYKPEEIGVVLSNANSSLDTDIRYYESTRQMASPALFVYTLPNIVMGEICIRQHLKGENAFFITPEFDADFMQKYVSGLINNHVLQCCICGWTEILEQEYKTVLFLVEKSGHGVIHAEFTTENIIKYFES